MDENKFYFDQDAADRVCRFVSTQLRHWKGEHAGELFTLLQWQKRILSDLFGWKRPDGTRRYRLAYIEIPRKQGKTFFGSAIALYLLCADGEPGAEVYSIATDTPQAGLTLENCRKMVEASPALKKRVAIKRWNLEHKASRSTYRALSGERSGKHGLSVHGCIADELHEWPASHREIWDALQTSTGARRQPLTVAITTAGHGNDKTLCRELHDKAVKYISGEIKEDSQEYDDTFYPVIFGAGPEENWEDEQTWIKTNPSLGQTVPLDYLRKEYIKAKETLSYQNEFRRLFLCQWTQQATRWLDLEKWDEVSGAVDLEALKGERCIVGLDIGQNFDLTAISIIFPQPDGTWIVVPRVYCPQQTINRRSRDEGLHYRQWAEEGHLIEMTANGGHTTDYDLLEGDLLEIAATYDVVQLGYDYNHAGPVINHLEAAGVTTVPVYQGFKEMSPACKEFEKRIIDRTILFQANPVFRHCAGNVEIESNRYGSINLAKPARKGKYAGAREACIDAITATVIAVRRLQLTDGTTEDKDFDASTAISFV